MAATHSGATAPVRAQGPARYSVLEHGLRNNVSGSGSRVWSGMGGSLARVGGLHARPELDAMTRSGSVGGLGFSCSSVGGAEGGGLAVIF